MPGAHRSAQCLTSRATLPSASLGVELLQAEVTGPLTLRRLLQGGPQAVQVVASVTVITEEKLVLSSTISMRFL